MATTRRRRKKHTFESLVQSCIDALAEIVEDSDQDAGSRIRAAGMILDRAQGKPTVMQQVEEAPLVQMELHLYTPGEEEPSKMTVKASEPNE